MVIHVDKYIILLSNYVRAYILLAVVAFITCAFPWGSYGWMSYFDFHHISVAQGRSMAIDTVATESFNVSIRQWEMFDDVMPIAEGTPIRIYGYYRDLPENPQTYHCLIQAGDTLRGVAFRPGKIPEVIINGHERTSNLFFFHQLVYASDAEKMKGKTLDEIEERLGMARAIFPVIFTDGTRATSAFWPGYDLMGSDYYKRGFVLVFQNGVVTNYTGRFDKEPSFYRWLAKLGNFWMSRSVAHYVPGYYTPTHGYGPFRSWNYAFRWIARGVMGLFDLFMPMLLCLLMLTVFYFTVYRIEALGNGAIALLQWGAFLFICGLYLIYTMEFSPNLLFFFISFLMSSSLLGAFLYRSRCPNCHAVGTIGVDDIRAGEKTKVSLDTNRTYDKDYGYSVVGANMVRHTTMRTHYTDTHIAEGQDYHLGMHCSKCGCSLEVKEHVTTRVSTVSKKDGVELRTTDYGR